MIAIGLIRELSRLGVVVGRYPVWSLLLGLLVTVPGLFGLIFGGRLDPAMNEGFVSASAPSHREIADQQAFFGRSGQPWYMALFGETEGNLLDPATFNELNEFYEHSMGMNLSLDGVTHFQFQKLCYPLCGINEQIQKLMDPMYSWMVNLKYPVSEILSFDVNIGKHVYRRNESEKGEITSAKMIAFFYTALITDATSRDQLQLFEQTVDRLAREHNANPNRRVNISIHGTNTVGEEVKKGFMDTMLVIAGSVGVASFSFLLMVVVSSWLRGKFGCHRLLLGLLALVLPPLATSSGVGLLCLVGVKINMLFIMAPIGTLVFLSHLHNVLHILRTFDNTEQEAKRNQFNRSERLSATYEQCAPIIVITNLGLIFGFGAARLFLARAYGQYSLAVALSLLILWVLELLVFGAFLSFSCKAGDETPKYYESNNSKRSSWSYNCSVKCARLVIRPYAAIVTSIAGRIVGILLIVAFLALPVQWGLRGLRSDMDFRNFLPATSSANAGFDKMDTMWWNFHQPVFIINRPPNFTNPEGWATFRAFVDEVEAIPNALNTSAHMSWIFDYFRAELKTNFHSPNASLSPPNMTKFHEFISTFPYQAWANGVRYEFLDEEKKQPVIKKMVLMPSFHKIVGLNGKRELINRCRQVALHFPQMEISTFDTDSRTADIMTNVLPTFYKWSLVFLITMAIVPLVALWNLAAALLCLVGAGFFLATAHAFSGLLAQIPLDLLNSTMIITICAVGLRISVHFIGEFLLVWAHDDRVARALQSSAEIVLKVTFLTAVCVLPLFFLSTVPLFLQFAATTSVALGAALLTTFVVLPLIAGLLPTRIISLETCC